MRFPLLLEKWRIRDGAWASSTGDDFGAFVMPGPCSIDLRIIASPGDADPNIPWEHVSVSTTRRNPNWEEMSFVKDLFWDKEEWVMQFHPAESQYVNQHPYCLHLWRPVDGKFPTPPSIAVGDRVGR